MEGGTVQFKENSVIVIRTSADLFLSGSDQAEVRFFGAEDRVQVREENGVLRIENHSGLDLMVPGSASVRVEKVGGSAFLQDLGSLEVQKVGGDLAMQRVGRVEIGKVGGTLNVLTVNGPFRVQKVGGDFTARELSGPATVEMVGGTASLQVMDGESLSMRAGGDLDLYLTRSVPSKVELRSGGNSRLFITGETNARFELVSDNEVIDLRITNPANPIQGQFEQRRYEFAMGSGEGRVELRAGGDILVSDEMQDPPSLAAEFERLETSWKNARENRARFGWPGHFDPERSAAWADMISRRAQEAARRAEHRAQSAARRIEEQTRRTVDREMRRGGFDPFSAPPAPPTPPPAPSLVTEKERLMVLQMLQEGKISVEQAEALVRALEGRYSER